MGSMVAGIVFALSGHFILGINMPDLDVQVLLPALLLVADDLLQKPSYGSLLSPPFWLRYVDYLSYSVFGAAHRDAEQICHATNHRIPETS